ncbi:MAG: hypothetical protein KC561_03970 [Myxococcales bacterium]|nr:hypothetical protein [Myxococcales bacterium]
MGIQAESPSRKQASPSAAANESATNTPAAGSASAAGQADEVRRVVLNVVPDKYREQMERKPPTYSEAFVNNTLCLASGAPMYFQVNPITEVRDGSPVIRASARTLITNSDTSPPLPNMYVNDVSLASHAAGTVKMGGWANQMTGEKRKLSLSLKDVTHLKSVLVTQFLVKMGVEEDKQKKAMVALNPGECILDDAHLVRYDQQAALASAEEYLAILEGRLEKSQYFSEHPDEVRIWNEEGRLAAHARFQQDLDQHLLVHDEIEAHTQKLDALFESAAPADRTAMLAITGSLADFTGEDAALWNEMKDQRRQLFGEVKVLTQQGEQLDVFTSAFGPEGRYRWHNPNDSAAEATQWKEMNQERRQTIADIGGTKSRIAAAEKIIEFFGADRVPDQVAKLAGLQADLQSLTSRLAEVEKTLIDRYESTREAVRSALANANAAGLQLEESMKEFLLSRGHIERFYRIAHVNLTGSDSDAFMAALYRKRDSIPLLEQMVSDSAKQLAKERSAAVDGYTAQVEQWAAEIKAQQERIAGIRKALNDPVGVRHVALGPSPFAR